MASAKPLDKEINHYLTQLNTEQKKAVLTVVKTFAQEENWWNDKTYMSEMSRRFQEMETGKVKTLSLEDLETSAPKAFKNKYILSQTKTLPNNQSNQLQPQSIDDYNKELDEADTEIEDGEYIRHEDVIKQYVKK